MKSSSLLVLACLVSTPILAQSLPDEINYSPYDMQYQSLKQKVSTAESHLGKTRKDLTNTQKHLSDLRSHIAGLYNSIQRTQYEINNNLRMIPELQREVYFARDDHSQLGNEIRRLQYDEEQLNSRFQNEYRNLRPLEDAVDRRERRVDMLRRELNQHERIENEALSRLKNAEEVVTTLDKKIGDETHKIKDYTARIKKNESQITDLQNGINKLESESLGLSSEISQEDQKVSSLNKIIQDYQTELNALKTQNAPQEKILEVQQKLNAVTATRNTAQGVIKSLKIKLTSHQKQIGINRSKLAALQSEQASLPSQVAQAQARFKQLADDRPAKFALVRKYQKELEQAQKNVQLRKAVMLAAVQDLRREESNLMRQRQVVDDIDRQLQVLRHEIDSLNVRYVDLSRRISGLDNDIKDLEESIPRLQEKIKVSQYEIAESEKEVVTSVQIENQLMTDISQQENVLADLIAQRDSVQAKMEQRLSLYTRYLNEAKELGSSQSNPAIGKGQREGERLAKYLGTLNGSSVGKELGNSEAKFWGLVRGEVQGYESGYLAGRASEGDITRGQEQGYIQGKQDAQNYAQKNFRPVFFEEFLQDEFKKPIVQSKLLKSFGYKLSPNQTEFRYASAVENKIPYLTESEVENSNRLETELDPLILGAYKEVQSIQKKASSLGKASVAYVVPEKIPYHTPDCSKVYKGIAVFKSSCAASYKDAYKKNYLESSEKEFSHSYGGQYTTNLEISQVTNRDSSFAAEYNQAAKITEAFGLKIGREEIYRETFAKAYQASYENELPVAREQAKIDASIELAKFMAAKPLLTLSERKLVAENFRGGEEVLLSAKVKNISSVSFEGAALMKIAEVRNAEVVVRQSILNKAKPQSMTEMLPLKVRISPNAKSGDKLVIKGTIELPGDVYKTRRIEQFEISETLTANPANDLNLAYNKTPSVKGFFRRIISFLNIKISPRVEDLASGYQFSLSAVGENSDLIDLKETNLTTGALKVSEEKSLRFSYVFPDKAKGKKVTLKLNVIFNNEIIESQLIELNPK